MNQALKNAVAAWISNGNEKTFKAMVRTSYESIEDKPVFMHDCDHCLFFGRHDNQDLYVCVNKTNWKRAKHTSLDSMILRCGDSSSDYFSYHPPESVSFPPPEEWFERMRKNHPGYVLLLSRMKEVGLYQGEFK